METRGTNILLLTSLKWDVKSSFPIKGVHVTARTWPDCCVELAGPRAGHSEGQLSWGLRFSITEVPRALKIKKMG